MKFKKDFSESSGGPNHYISLKDGESVVGIIKGDERELYVLYDDKGKRSEVPEGTPYSKWKFQVNFIVKDGAVYVAKILEGGAMIYRQLEKLSKDYDLDETAIKIEREGDGLNTEYSVVPVPPKGQPSKEALAHIRTVTPIDLEPKRVKNFAPGADNANR